MGIVGVSAEIRTGNLSNTSQKRHRLKLSLRDLTQKFDARPMCASTLTFYACNKRTAWR